MLADQQVSAATHIQTDDAARLRLAIGRVSRRLRDTPAGAGLTATQISVLFCVVRRGPLGMGELARIEGLNPTLLSRLVGGLEAAGLVGREPRAEDRRAVVVAATPAGAALRTEIQAERAAALARELEGLGAADRAALAAAVPALERLADQLADRPTPADHQADDTAGGAT